MAAQQSAEVFEQLGRRSVDSAAASPAGSTSHNVSGTNGFESVGSGGGCCGRSPACEAPCGRLVELWDPDLLLQLSHHPAVERCHALGAPDERCGDCVAVTVYRELLRDARAEQTRTQTPGKMSRGGHPAVSSGSSHRQQTILQARCWRRRSGRRMGTWATAPEPPAPSANAWRLTVRAPPVDRPLQLRGCATQEPVTAAAGDCMHPCLSLDGHFHWSPLAHMEAVMLQSELSISSIVFVAACRCL